MARLCLLFKCLVSVMFNHNLELFIKLQVKSCMVPPSRSSQDRIFVPGSAYDRYMELNAAERVPSVQKRWDDHINT